MSEVDDFVQRATTVHDAIGTELDQMGGFLECLGCAARRSLGSTGGYVRNGWPKHCGHTMRWWTQRQIDAGEASA